MPVPGRFNGMDFTVPFTQFIFLLNVLKSFSVSKLMCEERVG